MLKITYHKNTKKRASKLDGLNSINTSALNNQFCIDMYKNKKSICSYCYATNQEKQYTNVNKRYLNHLQILSETILTDKQIKAFKFTSQYVRLHSFGELVNLNHLLNFYRICELWPGLNFTLWTKRIDLISKLSFKPNNLRLIYSNPILNRKLKAVLPRLKALKFTAVFSVFDKLTAIANKTNINCNGNCKDCLLCYRPYNKPGIMQINEILKSDQKIEPKTEKYIVQGITRKQLNEYRETLK